MSIVDKINEKTGKFANNITEAVADLLGKEVKATTILETLEEEGNSNNIMEAIDNIANKANSNNIAEAIDQYNGDDIPKSMTIEEALENIGEGPGPEPTPTEKLLFSGGAVEVEAMEGSSEITPPFMPVFTEPYEGWARLIFHNYQNKIDGDSEWTTYPTWETLTRVTCTSADSYSVQSINFPNEAEMYISDGGAFYTYEGSGLRVSKWDSVEILTTNEEFKLVVNNINLGEQSYWEYRDVNAGDTLRVRLKDMVGHIGSETEVISDIDVTGTIEFTVGKVDNYTFYAYSSDDHGLMVEFDGGDTPRYSDGIEISQIIITRIPTVITVNSATPNFNSMTKAEIQAWADENNISGVDQNSQTKAEMIETIEAALNA